MKKSFLILLLILIGWSDAFAQTKEPVKTTKNGLIGLVYDQEKNIPFFKGYRDIGGAIMNMNYTKDTIYTLHHMYKPNKHILIFSKKLGFDNDSKSIILDTVSIKGGEELFANKFYVALRDCMLNNAPDNEVFAVMVLEDKEYLKKVKTAYRANKKTCKIEKLKNTENISCFNLVFGMD